jgi:protein kinase C substrate 80K-H
VNRTPALPGFYCKNKGHIPGYISHTYVNDGVCDYENCCDGSDEWAHVGGKKCEDRCKEIGKEWRKQDELKQKSLRNALKKKEDLIVGARTKRAGIETAIREMKLEVIALEVKEREAKRRFEEVERRERGRVSGSKGKGSRTTVLADLAKKRVEELRGTLVDVVEKRNHLRERVKELEGILKTFSVEYNPNFNDEGVKRAVKAWQDYAANTGEFFETPAEDRDIADISKEDTETEGINWKEWETEEESELDASKSDLIFRWPLLIRLVYQIENYLPTSVRVWVRDRITDLRILLIENGILADNTSGGAESKVVTDARSAHSDLETTLQNLKGDLKDKEEDLVKDYGENDIFRALSDKCITKDSGEYTYELCFMKGTTQKSKKGHGSTGMGNFVRFDKTTVDEEGGLGKGERLVLKYENGQGCWNGPNRETTVVVGCAEEDEIWKISETEKCLYRMEVGSPVACAKAGSVKKDGKDEL